MLVSSSKYHNVNFEYYEYFCIFINVVSKWVLEERTSNDVLI